MTRTWALVADAAHARLFGIDQPGEHWTLLQEFDNPAGRAHGRDFLAKEDGAIQHKEGSFFRSSLEPLSMKQVESRRFAHDLCGILYAASQQRRYERLILIAAPEFLGMLRKELPRILSRKLMDDIPRDYGRLSALELEKQVGITHLA